MISPLDPTREQGIRLALKVGGLEGSAAQKIALELLAEIDRLRHVEQGLRTQLSVYERRDRTRGG